MEIILDELGRILLICGGIGLVLITSILVICFVAPSCWCYQYVHKRKDNELLANVELRRKALYGDEVVLAEFPHIKSTISQSSETSSVRDAVYAPPYLQDVYRQTYQQEGNTDASRHSASTSSAYSSQRSSKSSVSHRGSSLSSVSEYSELALAAVNEENDLNEKSDVRSVTLPGDNGVIVPYDVSLTSGLSQVSSETLRDSVSNINPYSSPPQVNLNLHLSPGNSDNEQSTVKLFITINGASYLPPRQYGGSGSVDAYLLIKLTRLSDTNIPLLEVKTRSVRRSSNPQFGETYQAELRRIDLKDVTLEVTAYDQDRYANATELSHGKLALEAMFDLLTSLQSQPVNLSMQPSNKILGEILLSVVYLPTAQRVTLTVVKARALVFEGTINPYVRVILLSSLGRSIKRKKTSYKINNPTPSFSETLSFDVLPTQIENLTFLVTVCHRGNIQPSVSDESGSETEVIKDTCIGKIAIGKNVRGTSQKLHWLSVLENPRKVISHWHDLH